MVERYPRPKSCGIPEIHDSLLCSYKNAKQAVISPTLQREGERETETERQRLNSMDKIHAVCIPYPVQSHISSMMKLAKILHFRGQDIPTLSMSTQKNCLEPFRNLIHRLNNTTYSNVPPVSCIVSDGCMSFTLQAAKEFGIPDTGQSAFVPLFVFCTSLISSKEVLFHSKTRVT
ncbi:hypothetical protein C5167_008219 [Papaver somniferum]|uniref:Uncharacterized protein n=1 Tax=Papaver somniferum TaxID=3469 RepID=A0A4Y7JXS1_PAPSO|nr:hypothetical protein C5167_008219 [Papaver somniferum]